MSELDPPTPGDPRPIRRAEAGRDMPAPDNAMLRQMVGMRRDMAEVMATNARVVELLGRMNLRLDEMTARNEQGLSRLDGRLREMASDLVLMENRIVTAITEVRNIAARLDEADAREHA